MKSILLEAFKVHFNALPSFLVRAPGRVNLIGEHTDYNDGYVLPMAIDRAVWIALRRRQDRQVLLHSLDYGQTAQFFLDNLQKGTGWAEYLKGVAWTMQLEGFKLGGWEGVIAGDVPRGSGLSSSAALEMAAARAFAAISHLEWDPAKMAHLCQKAENQWVGVNCGIMDQMTSAAAKAGHVLFLDCRSLEYQHIPLPPGVAIMILDTGTRRGLVESAYNERRLQCESAAQTFGVRALRDMDMTVFQSRATELDPVIRRRARHIISENERVLEAVNVMHRDEPAALGKLLNASHASLRDDFEVSSPALDKMAEIARHEGGCYGARMTGAGFGGCAVAIAEEQKVPELVSTIADAYSRETGLKPSIYISKAADGAGLEEF